MTTFTQLTANQFKAKLTSLSNRSNGYKEILQELALQVVFHAVANNDSRKADQVVGFLDTLHAKQFASFIMHFSGLARITKAERKKYEEENNKPMDASRLFKVSESKKVKQTGTSEAIAFAMEHVTAAEAHTWLNWKKPSQPAQKSNKPFDFNKNFGSLITKASESEVTEESKAQYAAMRSFLAMIQQGKTLHELRAEIEESVKAKLTQPVKTKSTATAKAA